MFFVLESEPVSIAGIFQRRRAIDEKHGVVDGVFLIDGATPLKDACNRHGLRFRYENTGIGTASNVSFER